MVRLADERRCSPSRSGLAWSRRAGVVFGLCLAAAHVSGQSGPTEKLIATVPDGIELVGPPQVDPNGKTVADVSEIVFRRDGGQVAYIGFKGGRSWPVVGSTVGETFDYLATPVFGGEHVFFRAGNRTSA